MTRAVNLLLADLWIEDGRFSEAESRLQSILLAAESDADLDNPQFIEANEQNALLLMQTLRTPEAAEVARDVVERSRRVLGPEHKETIDREISLAVIASQNARLSGDPSSISEHF